VHFSKCSYQASTGLGPIQDFIQNSSNIVDCVQLRNRRFGEDASFCYRTFSTLFWWFCVVLIRVLRGLKFFARSRPAPTKFKPAPHLQEFEKSCPLPPAPATHFFGPKSAAVRKLLKIDN